MDEVDTALLEVEEEQEEEEEVIGVVIEDVDAVIIHINGTCKVPECILGEELGAVA